jgi:hypothetical protein
VCSATNLWKRCCCCYLLLFFPSLLIFSQPEFFKKIY